MKKIYWSNFCQVDALPRMKLLNERPQKVITALKKKMILREKNLVMCPASNDFFQNTYMLTFPKHFEVNFDKDGNIVDDNNNFFLFRQKQFENRISVELDISWIFFSEENLILEVMPPFYHQTSLNERGVLACGKFDIGAWFRPINLSFMLWENENKFVAEENEPICYLRFLTEEPIKLLEFNITQPLLDIAKSCVFHPNYYRKQIPLLKRYEIFKRSNLKIDIMKEIKMNLVGSHEY